MNCLTRVWVTIKQLMLGLSRKLMQLSLENVTARAAASWKAANNPVKWQN